MQLQPGHTHKHSWQICKCVCAVWLTERKVQAIPFSFFPSHCHRISSCSWSTVYTAWSSRRVGAGHVVRIHFRIRVKRCFWNDYETSFWRRVLRWNVKSRILVLFYDLFGVYVEEIHTSYEDVLHFPDFLRQEYVTVGFLTGSRKYTAFSRLQSVDVRENVFW